MTSKKGKAQPAGVGMTPSKSELGIYIRSRRLGLDLRQVPLAKKCGFAKTFVSQLEVGIRTYLKDRQLERLAKALQCDTEELRKRMPVKHVAQPTTELGKLIRSRREELGMSIVVFAKKLKVTPRRAKLLEIRKSPSIHYGFVKPLAIVLDLDPSVLVKFAERTQKETKSELGQLVRTRRKELAMSLGDLAKKLGVSRQFVDQIEFGQCRLSENDEMIAKLAQVLDLDAYKLEVIRPERRLKQMKHTNPLGGFLFAKRLELRLTQREVGERADIATAVVSSLETGRLSASTNVLDKLSKALDCEIPPDMIPPPHVRKGGHRAARFTIERETGLGKFVTMRRLDLKFSQAKIAQRASMNVSIVSRIERGAYLPGGHILEKLSKALECEIPVELIPVPGKRGPRGPRTERDGFASSVGVNISGQNLADLERIKELSSIRVNTEAVRKALKTLRLLLEKQNDKYVICLRKDKDIVELEFLF